MKAAARAALLAIIITLVGPTPGMAKLADVGSWSRAPDMFDEHVGHTATLLQDGRVLVAGGTNLGGDATATCELFDPKTDRWTRGASMNVARAYHSATLLKNGDVLVVGGQSSTSAFPYTVLASAEIYQPAKNRWITVRSAHVARAGHVAVRLRDGRVLIAGRGPFLTGDLILPDAAPVPAEDRAEIYDPKAAEDPYHDPWSPAGSGLLDVDGRAFTPMPDGKVLATGGDGGGFAIASAELFDPTLNVWKSTTWPMGTPRYDHTATLLPDGKVLLVGGYTTQRQPAGGFVYPNGELLTGYGVFDLRGNNMDPGPDGKIPRIEHTATLLRNGLVLIVGSAFVSRADSQLFDPANTENLISTGMPMDRYLHTATLLSDGRVLIAGGFGVGSQKTAWIYSSGPSLPPAPSGSPPIWTAALMLLIMLIAFGLIATSGRVRRWNRNPSDDAEWIEP